MKCFSIILILLSVSTIAESSELTERIKKRLSFDNCSVQVYNGKAYYYNCKASDKVKDAINEIEYAKQNKKWNNSRCKLSLL